MKKSYIPDIQANIGIQIETLRQEQAEQERLEEEAIDRGEVEVIRPSIQPPPTKELMDFWVQNSWWLQGSGRGKLLLSASDSPRLDVRIKRLQAMRDWINVDPELGRFVDTAIGQQVKAAERRQRIFATGLGVVSLIVGWLLSAISPAHLVLR